MKAKTPFSKSSKAGRIEDERYIVKEGKTDSKGPAGLAGAARCADGRSALSDLDLPAVSGVSWANPSGSSPSAAVPTTARSASIPTLKGSGSAIGRLTWSCKDISQHYHQWGARRFWFTDAQFITGKEAYPQCTEILERILGEKLEIEWSGYIRTSLITPELAKLMVRSGVGDLEVAITSGSQEVLNNLHMGFKLERLYDGCRYLAEAGFKGKVILNYSLNSPKETEESLLQSVESYKMVASILGEERVFPLMFFLGIQPNTDLEQRLLEEGYLSAGYNPLMLTPTSIRKLLYNPAPLNKIHRQGLPREPGSGSRGAATPDRWTGSLSQTADGSDITMPMRT